MIRYTLTCKDAHRFESWFQSGEAFETLKSSSMVNCPECGSTDINKELMAPAVQKDTMSVRPLAESTEHPLEKMRKEVEKNADYVGKDFATEARAIHDGDKPERAIYGEANPKEAKKLLEDGVPVMPLPFMSRKQTN